MAYFGGMNDDQPIDIRALKFGLFARNLFFISFAVVGGYWFYGDKYRFEWSVADVVATTLFVLLFSWCLTPSFRLDDGLHDDAANSLALRLGKRTKRTLHSLKRLLRTT